MKSILAALTVGFTFLAGVSYTEAATITLYDGGASGVTPENYNVPQYSPPGSGLSFTNLNPVFPFTPTATRGSVNNVNSTANNSIYAGFSNYTIAQAPVNNQFPDLDPNNGYTLNFAVEIIGGSFTNSNRAGFSVLVISSNVASGVKSSIELAFQNDRIFAQNDPSTGGIFTAGEQYSVNLTGSGLVNYSLQVLGTSYTLSANGSTILSNQLRDYTSFTGPINPYSLRNFLFFGDNTTSANGNFNLGAISATTNVANVAAVPYEFSPTIGLLTLGAFATISYLKKRQT